MRTVTGRRAGAFAVGVGIALASLVPVAVAAASVAATRATHTSTSTAASKLAKVGHGSFWECPTKSTELLIAVNTLTLHPGNTLNITFAAKNQGAKACNYVAPYAGAAPGPTSTALQVGPCGSISFEIVGAHHHNVWPGAQPFNCPALGFAQLAANATVSGSGSWTQTRPGSTQRVPAGTYTLVVDGHFSFPLRVAAS
jgi:hypothetical protein